MQSLLIATSLAALSSATDIITHDHYPATLAQVEVAVEAELEAECPYNNCGCGCGCHNHCDCCCSSSDSTTTEDECDIVQEECPLLRMPCRGIPSEDVGISLSESFLMNDWNISNRCLDTCEFTWWFNCLFGTGYPESEKALYYMDLLDTNNSCCVD